MCGVKAGHIAGQPHRAALRRKRQGRSSSRPRSVRHCSPVCRRPRSAVTGASAGSLFARSPAGPDRRIGGSERRPGTPTESDWLSPLSLSLASTVNQAADGVRPKVSDGRPVSGGLGVRRRGRAGVRPCLPHPFGSQPSRRSSGWRRRPCRASMSSPLRGGNRAAGRGHKPDAASRRVRPGQGS